MDNVSWDAKTKENDRWLKFGPELKAEALESTKQRKIDFWNTEVNPNEDQEPVDKPVSQIHTVIAERRSVLLDSQQLFT